MNILKIALCLYIWVISTAPVAKKKVSQAATQIKKPSVAQTASPGEKDKRAKEVLTEFFSNTSTLRGLFFHITTAEDVKLEAVEPIVLFGVRGTLSSGHFAMDMRKPTRFKWKYTKPVVRQIARDNISDNHIRYKEGQGVKMATDGTNVELPNNKKPHIIYQALPITFLFDVPVSKWIEEVEILEYKWTDEYIRILIGYKNISKQGMLKGISFEKAELVFSKNPLCLLQWMFKDPQGQTHQLTLYNLKIDQPLPPHALKID